MFLCLYSDIWKYSLFQSPEMKWVSTQWFGFHELVVTQLCHHCRPQQNLHPVDQSQDATSILHYSRRFCFIHMVSDSRDFHSSDDAGLYCLPVWNWHTSFTKQYMKYVSHFYSKYIHIHFAMFYNWQTLWNIMEKMLFIGIVMKQQHTNVQCVVKTLYLSDSWIVDQGMHMFSGRAVPVYSSRSTMKMLF